MIAAAAFAVVLPLIVGWGFAGAHMAGRKLAGREPSMAYHAVFHELKPFYRPAVVIWLIAEFVAGFVDVWSVLCVMPAVVAWFAYRNADHDDRWRRRCAYLGRRLPFVAGRRITAAVDDPTVQEGQTL